MGKALDLQLSVKQFDFVTAEEHYLALVGGIGSGKTQAGCKRALAASLGYIGSQRIPTPNLGIISAPTFPMLRNVTLRTFKAIAGDLITDYNKNEGLMTLANGSEILFVSAHDPEHLRGPNISWWFGDEAALYEALVWLIMIGRCREFGQFGYSWLATTPKGRNYIWKEFAQSQRANYRIIKARTADNPFLAKELQVALREAYTGDFARQELDGEFVAFEGLVYPEFSRDVHLTRQRPAQFKQVVAGVDWGFTNPGVMVVYGVDGDGRMWGLHEAYARQMRIEEWANTALELRNLYGVETFFCDPSEPTYIDALWQAGCRAVAANNAVNAGIQAVKQRLVRRQDGTLGLNFSLEFVHTASEFEQYQWQPFKGGGYVDKPMKVNDHTMDSTRYAVQGVNDLTGHGTVVTEIATYA
jgi:PBSX family phage terminase large subunit